MIRIKINSFKIIFEIGSFSLYIYIYIYIYVFNSHNRVWVPFQNPNLKATLVIP